MRGSGSAVRPWLVVVGGSPVDEEEVLVRQAYAAHGDELFGLAARSLGDARLAEEIVKETFVRTWRSRRFLGASGSIRTWLFSIGRYLVADAAEAQQGHEAPQVIDLRERRTDDLRRQAEAATTAIVARALSRLTEDHRWVLEQVQRRPVAEVADELGVPPAAVRARVFYALKSLHLAVEEIGTLSAR